MGIAVYQKGDLRRFGAQFRNLAGVLTDPTAVALRFTKPSGAPLTYTWALAQITRNSVGDFQRDESLDEAGEWHYTWVGTGVIQDTQSGMFMVEAKA